MALTLSRGLLATAPHGSSSTSPTTHTHYSHLPLAGTPLVYELDINLLYLLWLYLLWLYLLWLYLLWLYLPWLYGRIYYGYTYFVQARGMAVEQERQVRNSSTTFSVVAVA